MPASALGIDPTRVDGTAQFPVGYEIGDPRQGVFSDNTIKYCRANGAIAAGDFVHTDVTFATAAERQGTVISTSAVSQMIDGANDLAGVAISSGQFFWITTKGRAQGKTAGVAAGDKLGTTATAGTLGPLTATTPTAAEVIAAIAAADGKGAKALTATGTPVTGQSFVELS